MKKTKKQIILAITVFLSLFTNLYAKNKTNGVNMEKLKLETKWDKTFPKSDKVDHKKVTFMNHFGITIAADMYTPKAHRIKLPALAVCGPFGAVKEQCSGLYAQEMAERGFLTIAFDPSFCGESGGYPRYMNSPDINTEDFQAAIDFLSNLKEVDAERIGIIGICGWGGIALNTAAIDTRIKATAIMTMYDMSRIVANGYYDAADNEQARYDAKIALNKERTENFHTGNYKTAGGLPEKVSDDAPDFLKQYWAYYKTPRGYHSRSLNSNNGWATTATTSLLNTKMLAYSNEIRNAVLIVHGEKAHSRYFGEDAFKKLTGTNKELLIIPNATHCDLYDQKSFIPFNKLQDFFEINLK